MSESRSRLLLIALILGGAVVPFAVGPKIHAAPLDFPTALTELIDFTGYDDAKTTLQEALNQLVARHGNRILINEKAFQKDEPQSEVFNTEIALRPIPPMANTRYSIVLDQILKRVPSPSPATYLVREGYLEITTTEAARNEIWGEKATGPFYPLIHLNVREKGFHELLNDTASQASLNVVLDPRAIEKAGTKLTLKLRNAPADTALELIADMVELKLVRMRNIFYVTTPEHAAKIQQLQGKEKPQPETLTEKSPRLREKGRAERPN